MSGLLRHESRLHRREDGFARVTDLFEPRTSQRMDVRGSRT